MPEADALVIAAAILLSRTGDAHKAAHLALELSRELEVARTCRPPAGSYIAEESTCSYGWQMPVADHAALGVSVCYQCRLGHHGNHTVPCECRHPMHKAA